MNVSRSPRFHALADRANIVVTSAVRSARDCAGATCRGAQPASTVAPAKAQARQRSSGREESRIVFDRFESRQDNATHRQAQQPPLAFSGDGVPGMFVALWYADA